MATSVSGLLTLLFLIFIGPIYYLALYFFKKDRCTSSYAASKPEGREVLRTREYAFTLVGYAIGIGNLWRFPYIISQNGGTAALVAYIICAVLVSVPLFLYEMILGQYTKLSTIPTYAAIRPRWLSFGFAQAAMLFAVQSYFSMIIAYTLPYIVASCQDPLPWMDDSERYWKVTVLNGYPSEELKTSGLGAIQPKLALSLFIVCSITYFSIAFGKHVLAQVTYVTVIMPVVLVIIFVIRTAFLEGAGDGIRFYIGKFEGKQLLDGKVWATALSQILFSLSPGFGTAITFSSYAKPNADVFKICMIVAVSNSVFSIVGGFGIFAMVGNMAAVAGVPVAEKASSAGPGLAFVAIAEAMESFGPARNFMSVLFFVMLLTLGLDSAFAWTETLVSIMDDTMAMMGYRKLPTWKSSLIVSVALFLAGLVYTTRMGNQVLDVVDHYVGILFLLVLVFFESVMLNVDFGWERLEKALRGATRGLKGLPEGRGLFPKYLCRLDFHVAVPALTFVLAIYTFVGDLRTPYDASYPSSLLGFGWTLLGLFFATIFITLWKQDPSTLPPIEEDEKFKTGKVEMVQGNKHVEA